MAQTRADLYTQLKKIEVVYADFLTDFTAHPITGDIVLATNVNAVKQSIVNLILTNYGESAYNPYKGSNVRGSLFDLADDFVKNDLLYHIKQTISNSEPRAAVNNVEVKIDPDNDRVTITITFTVINIQQTGSVSILLRRVR